MTLRSRTCAAAISLMCALCLPAEAQRRDESDRGPGVVWRPLLLQSGFFLGVQHSYRLATEPGSRASLSGRFWPDYLESVRGLGGWNDGDDFSIFQSRNEPEIET
jgi:hypothetical protein